MKEQRIKAIIQHYRKNYQINVKRERLRFRKYSLDEAISKAALAEDASGKRLSHQRRIPRKVLRNSKCVLRRRKGKIRMCKTFAELHEYLKESIGEIKGIGPLAVYDTAWRIGANRGLEPGVIYLHAGTKQGAKAIGLNIRRKFIRIDELSREFTTLRKVKPMQLEDIFCIYKKCFECEKKSCPLPKQRCNERNRGCTNSIGGC